ncbi:putative bifunctional diguanylate cyclase/phosphodiesterase [Bacillus marinisedimentorum]|uniref:putative bifunctional diguanylate cyclase/phosphodiesterase n=1 Tax=Bacillus marinisedimentorum TaxID=1821260 RepID=UPI0008728833|nr:EAL domain-containing protein [Bacillus marinisedimentorum]
MGDELVFLFLAVLMNMLLIFGVFLLPNMTREKWMCTYAQALFLALSLWVTAGFLLLASGHSLAFFDVYPELIFSFVFSFLIYTVFTHFLGKILAVDSSSRYTGLLSVVYGTVTVMLPAYVLKEYNHAEIEWEWKILIVSMLLYIITFFLLVRVLKQVRVDQLRNRRNVPLSFQAVFSFLAASGVIGACLTMLEASGLGENRDDFIVELLTVFLLILLAMKYGEKQYKEKQAELEENNEKLEFLAHHDPLTGLPNRMAIQNQIKMTIKSRKPFYLLFLDLDSFKMINDYYGHQHGDTVLKQMGIRLSKALKHKGTVSRVGGDEFVILLPGDEARLHDILDQLIRVVTLPISIDGKTVTITTSMGAACYPKHGRTAPALMKYADLAMYHAKDSGKNQYQIYSEEMLKESNKVVELKTDLRHALTKNQFRILYQPQIDLRSGTITGFEALLRWKHPGRGVISPVAFIPLAEETGDIVPIGEWVLRNAVRELQNWQIVYKKQLKMAVNISIKQLEHPNFIHTVEDILNETALDPSLLELEVTESLAMKNVEYALEVIEKLREFGVHVSIDDFGTGHSSLNYLRLLGIKHIKIDRTFIKDIEEKSESREIIRAILSIARHLRLDVTAEGIETDEQLQFLQDLDCSYGQGYLFARPLERKHAEAFLKREAETAATTHKSGKRP